MNTLKKIDVVLKYFNSIEMEYERKVYNKAEEFGLSALEMRRIINKLEIDKFITIKPFSHSAEYQITFEGQVFIEQGGYFGQFERSEYNNKQLEQSAISQVKLTGITMLLLIVGGISALYYILEILDKIIGIYPKK